MSILNTTSQLTHYNNILQSKVLFKGNEEQNKNKKIKNSDYENPVSRVGEYFNALNKSFKKSMGVGSRAFLECCIDPDSNFGASLIVGGIAAAIAFVVSLPGSIYKANVDFFTKKKEMDVFVRENSAEKQLYEQIDKKIKNGEKSQITNYQKMQISKSEAPKSLKKPSEDNEFIKGFFLMG